MVRRFVRANVVFIVFMAALLVVSSGAAAQNISSSSIDGIVTDQSNSALPGVTVTITSPALQVPQLTTVTDGQGHYRFIDLPRGTYQLVSRSRVSIRSCVKAWT